MIARGVGARIMTAALACGIAATGVLGVSALASPANAAPNTTVRITAASIDGHSLFSDTRADPVPLEPRPEVPFSVTIENQGDAPVEVRYVRITGAMMGIRFVRFQASVKRTVGARDSITISEPADFFDVDGQANGYINSSLQIVDENRQTLATKGFAADVDGKFLSSEGLMLMEVLLFFAIGVIQIILGVYRRRLPKNRFTRGILFAITFGSAAVAIVIGISMLRIGLLRPTTWVPAVLLSTAAGFILGYLSPGPLGDHARDAADEEVIDLVAAEAVARASGAQERRTTGGSVAPHESGGHVPAHQSGEFSAHESGKFEPHESGSFEPHESGKFAPQGETGSTEPLQ